MRIKSITYTLIHIENGFIHKVINNLMKPISTPMLPEKQIQFDTHINLSTVPTTNTTS